MMRLNLSKLSLCAALCALTACADDPKSSETPTPGADMSSQQDAGADMVVTRPDSAPDLDMPGEQDQGMTPDPDMNQTQDMGADLGGEADMSMPPTDTSRSARCATISARLRSGAQGKVISVKPAGAGMVEADGQRKTLRQVVSAASSGDIIELEDGTYTFPESQGDNDYTGLYFTKPNVTLRSKSGDPSAVILDSAYADHGASTAPITINAASVTVMDLTVKRSIFHLIHFSGDKGDNSFVHNVRLIDGGQQFMKSSAGSGTIDKVTVSCSDFTMTDAGRDNAWGYGSQTGNTTCYTGGIDTHEATNWNVADNRFEGIYCNAGGVQRPAHGKKASQRGGQTYTGGLAEHAIHMWDSPQGSGGHLLARNQIIDCARGIGLGFRAEVYDTKIINNTISTKHAGSGEHDVAISLERSHNCLVAYNTVMATHPQAYSSSIEYRFSSTEGLQLINNLTSHRLRSRDNAGAVSDGNVTGAKADWFKDAASGDLHLRSCDLAQVAGKGVSSDVTHDLDAQPRPAVGADVGADQCSP